MRKSLSVLGLTLLMLVAMDFGVAVLIDRAQAHGRLGALVRYFEYGRSVPGKHARWEADPSVPGNLYDVAWRDQGLAASVARFAAEEAGMGPVVRGYGMSFSGRILRGAQQAQPGLIVDHHAGPGAPPNFVYAVFLEDRPNRRAGDIAVLAILSSSVPALAALSNSTWVFEQPAPFTYPVFRPDGDNGLVGIEPLVTTADMHRQLRSDSDLAEAWAAQLAAEDAFYAAATYGAPWLDRSPFVRLVRRSLATRHVNRIQRDIIAGNAFPYADVLERMVTGFARLVRADGQHPVVFLIQSRDPSDANLLEMLGPTLKQNGTPYLATAEYFDPREVSGFLPDGHYREDVDRIFGEAFLAILRKEMARAR